MHLKLPEPPLNALQATTEDRIAPCLRTTGFTRALCKHRDIEHIMQQCCRGFGLIDGANDQQTTRTSVGDPESRDGLRFCR